MKIGFGNDHTALVLKQEIMKHVESKGFDCIDFGTNSYESVDYPTYGEKVANAILNKECDLGILICGTGAGMAIAANKIKGIRAVSCSEPYTAKLAREHNNANVLTFGARVVGNELAKMIVDSWLDAEFESGRHGNRVDLITTIENANL